MMAASMTAMGMNAQAAELPFTASYEADLAPEDALSNPQWQKYFLGTGTVAGGLLTVTTNSAAAGDEKFLEYRLDGGGAWNPTGLGTTVEFSFKTNYNDPSGWGGALLIGTGTRLWILRIGTNFISDALAGGDFHLPSNLGFDSSTFHTYRLTTAGDSGPLNLYVDGSPTPATSFAGIAAGTNRLAFGDLGGNEGGEVVWDYLRWTNTGAIAPEVPEPSMLSLAGVASVALLRKRRAVNK